MCDYSILNVHTRDAEVGDKLVVTCFTSGTRGFARAEDGNRIATCLLPGTEIAFKSKSVWTLQSVQLPFNTAIFRQKNQNCPTVHHDFLEFPDGRTAALAFLVEGQEATVLQLPAKPKNKAEEEEQRRIEYAG